MHIQKFKNDGNYRTDAHTKISHYDPKIDGDGNPALNPTYRGVPPIQYGGGMFRPIGTRQAKQTFASGPELNQENPGESGSCPRPD